MAITFDNIAGGELAEKFTMALAQIGRNILDPNMDPIAARGMTINLKFKPGSRGTIDIEFDIKTKLAGFQKSQTVFLVGQRSSVRSLRQLLRPRDVRVRERPPAGHICCGGASGGVHGSTAASGTDI